MNYELELDGQEYGCLRKNPIAIFDIQWDWEDHRMEERVPEPLLKFVVIRDTVMQKDGSIITVDIDITRQMDMDVVRDTVGDHLWTNRDEYR